MYMYHVSSTPIKTEHSHYSREFFHAHLKSISSVSCSKNRSDPYHFRFVLHVLDFIQLELLYTLHTIYTFCIWFLSLSIIKKFFSSMLLNVTFVEWHSLYCRVVFHCGNIHSCFCIQYIIYLSFHPWWVLELFQLFYCQWSWYEPSLWAFIWICVWYIFFSLGEIPKDTLIGLYG